MRGKSLNLTANGVTPTRWRARNHMSLSTAARKVRPIDSPIDSHTALTRWQISAMVIFGRGYRCLRGSKCPGTNSTEVCVCVPASILSSIVTLSTRSLLLSHHLILQRRQDGFASKSDMCSPLNCVASFLRNSGCFNDSARSLADNWSAAPLIAPVTGRARQSATDCSELCRSQRCHSALHTSWLRRLFTS